MKLLHQCLAFGAIALLATSCSQDAPWSGTTGEEGRISLKLQTDLSVATSTRANDAESPVKPDGERFKIKLENSDGSYSKEWDNLTKFNDEEGFPRGTYTITASYGEEDGLGFNSPYYVGTEELIVKAGETTEQSITASLANSMVSVRYSDSVKDYFREYSAAVEVDGVTQAFARDEARPCYVKSGDVKVKFTIIPTGGGQEVTVSPATFTAQPRRHYIVTANLKEVGEQMALVVEFEENVVKEDIPILLSDELYTTPMPEIKASGFNLGESLDTYESIPLSIKPEFQVIAYGGIKEAKFSVKTSNGKLPAFNSEVDLANADIDKQQLVEQSQLNCYGFFRKPEAEGSVNQMGVIDMKKFIENLEPGDYTFSLSVTDGLGRVSESELPTTLSTKVNPINFKIDQDRSTPTKFMSDQIAVVVYTTYAAAKDLLTFVAEDGDGNLKKAAITKVEEVPSSDSNYPFSYKYLLNVNKIDDTSWHVEANYPKKSSMPVDVEVTIPDYSVEVDAFARRALIKINPADAGNLDMLVSNAVFYWDNGSKVSATQITRDPEHGIVTISGLDPAKTYESVGVSYGTKITAHCTPVKFTTESENDVPNGDFSAANQKLNIGNLQVGGQYSVSPVNYTIKSSIDRSLPDGWSTKNQLTCWEGSSNKNTWFLVPSTYEEGGKAVLRNVGYNHNGTTPAKSGGAFNIKYYCENAPSDGQFNKAAGELFLGSYSYDGAEHRVDGISFEARPSYLEFDYDYDPVAGDDKGLAEVKVLNASGKVIAQGKVDLTNSGHLGRHVKIALTGYPYLEKAASIQVRFISSSASIPPINIPTGGALNEGQGLGNKTIGANTYHAVATGSVLEIDNVHLGYE